MASAPTVSVVLATYNRWAFTRVAVASVLAQSHAAHEVLVVDDGSTDGTRARLEEEFGDRIRCIPQTNQGRAAARNRGIVEATGELVAFLDSDDVWLGDKLRLQVDALNARPQTGLLHTFTEVIGADGGRLSAASRERLARHGQAQRRGYTYEALTDLCIMFLSTVIVRRSLLAHVGPLDESLCAFEDWDWYLRWSRETRIEALPVVTTQYRVHGGNTRPDEFRRGRIGVARKHLGGLSGQEPAARVASHLYLHLAAVEHQRFRPRRARRFLRAALARDARPFLRAPHLRLLLVLLLPDRLTRRLRAWRLSSRGPR